MVARVVPIAVLVLVTGTSFAAATSGDVPRFPWDQPGLRPVKATIAAKADEQIIEGRKTPRAKLPSQVVMATATAAASEVIVHPTPTFTTGLFPGGSDAFVDKRFEASNHWVGEIDQTWFDVFAGASGRFGVPAAEAPIPQGALRGRLR